MQNEKEINFSTNIQNFTMDTFYTRQNIVRNVIPCMTTSIPGYNEVHSSDFNGANSTTIKAKKRKWNADQSFHDINYYSGVPTKRVVSNELLYQRRPAEASLSILKLELPALPALCPGHLKDIGSSKNPSLNEQQSEKVLSLLGPLFTPTSESQTKEPFRKTIPINGSSYLKERSIEEDLALPELGLSPKRHYKSDLNLFNSESTCLFNSKPTKTSLNNLNQVSPKLNRERYVEIDDPMEITN
ncbi:5881_t:CDS:1 [Funneliformis geosporum]|uniref:19222_t:CDS:1 n=1 Tax=Funneliformis geosporum TaxID=1117311 RepID=A0A9W4SNB4_9GLOM|nr:19222_t:CDS:1 [Funneliformis geosporum]CAI2191102.1 5881_t:CDS:1 [Funneliformis geosporum]